jgi:endo-1,4-beta-xylanase
MKPNEFSRLTQSAAHALAGFFIIAFAGCATAQPTLKDAYKNDFLIGAAINQNQFEEKDSRGVPIIKAQFDSITPENVLKWESVHPEPDKFAFDAPDRYVEFGEKNHMFIIGHTLVWHSQTPRWVFQNTNGTPVDRDTLLSRMSNHIHTVVGRYKGRIKGWDVVNEALNDDGTMRQSPWMKIIGEDYIEKAFQFAHEADPDAQLHYNDYSLEKEKKREGAIALIKKLQAKGIHITAIGSQDHVRLTSPTAEEVDAAITDLGKLGVKVMITELDVDVNAATQGLSTADVAAAAQNTGGYTNGLPDSVQQLLAKRYADLFAVFLKHKDVVSRVTFWGVTDGDSWLNGRRGRMNHPLLFDREGKPKPAFDAIIKAASQPTEVR